MNTKGITVVGLAWFREEQWDKLREISDDRDDLETRYAAWLKLATKTLKRLRRERVHVEKVDVDLDELVEWCAESGRKVNAQARAAFAAERIQKKNSQ